MNSSVKIKRIKNIMTFLILLQPLSNTIIIAQNLVPNPGFESYSSCPTSYTVPNVNQINKAVPWDHPCYEGTSDFFHKCGYGPSNFAGGQSPHAGDGYAGFFVWNSLYEYREYIQAPLTVPLVGGTTYEVSFWVCRLLQEQKLFVSGLQSSLRTYSLVSLAFQRQKTSKKGKMRYFGFEMVLIDSFFTI